MKRLSTLVFLLFVCVLNAQEKNLGAAINEKFATGTQWFIDLMFYEIPITSEASVPWVVAFLLLGATLLTFYFRFLNVRGFAISLNILRGKYDRVEDKKGNTGEISHFQALTTALSGTVGLGNIAGVAIAISIGGPGATFWMILAGILGMTSKFAECTLGVKYRDLGADGTVYGGPIYYLKKGFKNKMIGKFFAIFFAIMCIGACFGAGAMFQSNQAADMFVGTFHVARGFGNLIFGIVLSIFVAVVILGGIKKIAKVTERIVPFMVGIYVLAAFVILIVNFDAIPEAIRSIFEGAFIPQGIAGGFAGVLVQGLRRGVFSNEAGLGSAAIAHSAVKTKYPASEGLVALLEPFIDTVVVCTITALVIIVTNTDGEIMTYGEKANGVLATSKSFASVIPWFPYVLALSIVLFAFSTMVSWSYYGLQSWLFLFGRNKTQEIIYKSLFCISVVMGSLITLEAVIGFSDALFFAMTVPNFIVIFMLLPEIKAELKKYLKAIQKK